MSERVTLSILVVLALCVIAALCIAAKGDAASAKDIILAVANGLIGAIGGWSAHKAVTAPAVPPADET